jgi:hypothetical protein
VRRLVGGERFDAAAARVPRVARRAIDRSLSRKVERPQLRPEVRGRLVEMLAADTERLCELTGLEPDGWSTWGYRSPTRR